MMIHGLKLVPTKDGYKTTILKGVTVSFRELNGRWFAYFPRALEYYAQADSLDDVVLMTRKKYFNELAAQTRARRPIESPKEEAMRSRRNPRRNPRPLIVAENSRFATINLSAEQGRGFFPVALSFTGDASVESKGFRTAAKGESPSVLDGTLAGPDAIEVSIPVSIYTEKGVDDPATLIFTIETVEEDVVGLTWRIIADESILLEDDE
jgi:hypothetical protein